MKILLASNNPKKAHELRTILANSGIEILTLADVPHYDEPIEDGRTFADNALIKARAGAQHTGLVTIADDSGFTERTQWVPRCALGALVRAARR